MIFRNRFLILSLLAAMLLIVATACTDDDDDRDPDAEAGTGMGTPSADFGTPSPTGDEEEEGEQSVPGPDQTIVPEATAPLYPEGTEVPESGLPTPDIDSTHDAVALRTVTPDAEGVGPQGDMAFPNVNTDTPNLENFTLTVTGEINIVEQGDDAETSIDLNYQQSDPETFHLYYDGDDEFVVEAWQVGDQMWISENGEVTEATDDLSEGFDVGSYLSVLPELNRISEAETEGEEDIEGHTTTHYVVPAEEAIRSLPGMQEADISDPEGMMELWVAEEEEAILRMIVDLQWTDGNDNENQVDLEYQVTNIGETEEIQPPDAS